MKLYEGLKTKSKKTESGFQVSNSKSSNNEKKEVEDNKESEEDIVDQEIEEKGVKININLNGEGKEFKFMKKTNLDFILRKKKSRKRL